MSALFHLANEIPVQSTGRPYGLSKLYFYRAGTTTHQNVYTTAALSVAHDQPVVADADGVFAPIFLNPDASYDYRYQLKESDDTLIKDIDNIPKNGFPSQTQFNALLALSDPYKRTAAEIAAGVTPTNYAYPPGDSRRWGITSDGSTDDATALQNWITCSAADFVEAVLYKVSGNAKCGTQLTIPSNLRMYLPPGSAIQATIDDTPIMKGLGVSNVKIYGEGSVIGYDGTTDWPSPTSNSEGLIHFNVSGATRCTNINVEGINVNTTWCAISIVKADRVRVRNVNIEEFMRYGVLTPSCTDFDISYNVIYKSNVTSANAYGIMATGDDAGGFAQERCTIIGNKIKRVRAWDGIMSHDVKKLTVSNNIIEDCRSGIDLGHLVAANIVEDLIVTGNQVTLTTTDAWAGAGAAHFGIALAGYDATNRIARAICANNIVNNHGNITGAAYSGDPGSYVFSYADDLAISGNVVANADNDVASVPGMQFIGTMNRVAISGNTLSGDMPTGGFKFTDVVCDVLSITGNPVKQTTNTNNAIVFSGSTISSLAIGDNPTNCTTPIASGTSTLTYSGTGAYRAVVNQAIANLATTASRQDTFTLANVVPGDSVSVTLPANWPAGLISSAPITGTGQVYLQLYNPTGGTLSMAADNFYFEIKKYI